MFKIYSFGKIRMRYFRWAAILVTTVVLLASFQYLIELYLKMSVRYAASSRIDFSDLVHDEEFKLVVDQRPAFVVAIAPVLSPSRSLLCYRDIVIYLANRLNRRPELITRKTYMEINELVRHRQCDMALVCTYPYVLGKRDFRMEVLVTPVIDNSSHYQSFIVVPRQSPATRLLDLANKRFAINDYLSSSGWLFPAQQLLSQQLNPDLFFSEVLITQSHDDSIDAVCTGAVDGSAVHSAVLKSLMAADPTLKNKIRILAKSQEWGLSPFVTHPDTPEAFKTQLRQLLVSMSGQADGLAILTQMGIDRFFIPPSDFYHSVEQDVLQLEKRP